MTATNNNNLTPYGTLANPFPAGIQKPTGSASGLLTYAGQTVNFLNPEMKSPYAVRWNFGWQYELSPNMVLEMAYIGNHAVHLPITYTGLNGIPKQMLSTSPVRDQALITKLTASTANPFLGLKTNAGTATTVNAVQLLARYPQFPVGFSSGNSSPSTGVYVQNLNAGSSYYNSLNIRLQRRLSTGLSAIFNFMQSKMIDQTTWLNDTDAAPERRISPFFRPRRVASAVTYDLPVGRGRKVNVESRWLDRVVGGWSITASYLYQAGGPLAWSNGSTSTPGDYVYFGAPLNADGRMVDGNAFNTSAFDTKSANQLQYHIRTLGTAFANARADGINEWNGSVLKKVSLARIALSATAVRGVQRAEPCHVRAGQHDGGEFGVRHHYDAGQPSADGATGGSHRVLIALDAIPKRRSIVPLGGGAGGGRRRTNYGSLRWRHLRGGGCGDHGGRHGGKRAGAG